MRRSCKVFVALALACASSTGCALGASDREAIVAGNAAAENANTASGDDGSARSTPPISLSDCLRERKVPFGLIEDPDGVPVPVAPPGSDDRTVETFREQERACADERAAHDPIYAKQRRGWKSHIDAVMRCVTDAGFPGHAVESDPDSYEIVAPLVDHSSTAFSTAFEICDAKVAADEAG